MWKCPHWYPLIFFKSYKEKNKILQIIKISIIGSQTKFAREQ
jgi:hypothetical protein